MPKTYSERLPETIVIKVSKEMKSTIIDMAYASERTQGAQVRFLIRAQLRSVALDKLAAEGQTLGMYDDESLAPKDED